MSQRPDNQMPATVLSFESRPGFDASSGSYRKLTSVLLRADTRTAALVRTCPDREWKTLCLLATCADERGLARLGEDEIATLLGVSLAAARARVRALEGIAFEGRPLIKVKRDRLRDDEHTYMLYTVNFLPLAPQFYQEELFPRTDDEVRAAMELAKSKAEAAAASVVATSATAPAGDSPPRMAAAPVKDRRMKNVYGFAEEKLGRPLSSKEILAIQSWAEEYGFPPEVIKALFDEGSARGKSHLSYLEAVARRWHSEGIRTLVDVERSREEYRQATDQYASVISYLNLGRRLTQAEIELLEKWSGSWAFAPEVILKACSTTVNISSPNFRYIDRVLANWRRAGISTLAQAEQALADFENGGRGAATEGTASGGGPAASAPPATGGGPDGGPNGTKRTMARVAKSGRPLKNYQLLDGDRDEEFYEQFLTRFDKAGKDK